MNDKFNYPIFPDRIYTLSYVFEGQKVDIKISGEEILAYFHRQAYLDYVIDNMTEE